jgi:hypothetical protein
MRNPVAIIVLLILLGIVPIVAFAAMGVVTLNSAGWNRMFGGAFTVLLAPFGFAGLLMIVGAAMLNRTRRAGRIVATVGTGIVTAGTAFLGAAWLLRAGRCVEASSFCIDRLLEGGGLVLYALMHIGVIVLMWRVRRGELSSAV